MVRDKGKVGERRRREVNGASARSRNESASRDAGRVAERPRREIPVSQHDTVTESGHSV